jgi:hypothetical protein
MGKATRSRQRRFWAAQLVILDPLTGCPAHRLHNLVERSRLEASRRTKDLTLMLFQLSEDGAHILGRHRYSKWKPSLPFDSVRKFVPTVAGGKGQF